MTAASNTSVLYTQRDLNCLSDPERNTRKRALEKINKELDGFVKKPQEFTPDMAEECMTALQKPLLKAFADQAEKCRELSVLIVCTLLPATRNPTAFARSLFPVIRQRIGTLPQEEESEEVRLGLLLLTKAAVACFEKSVGESLDDLANILEKASSDKFPDAKKVTSELVVEMCAREGGRVAEYCPPLVKALQANLVHQQQKIRSAALQAIGAAVPLAPPKVLEDALPALNKLNLDRAIQLREGILRVAATWLGVLPACEHPRVLPLLLHGAADEMQHVQEAAVLLMEQAGSASAGGGKEEEEEEEEGDVAGAARHYPSAFKGQRPCKGSRRLVRGCLEQLMPLLLTELCDWSVTTRTKAAATLCNVLVYAERSVKAHAEKLLAGLARAAMDDEQTVSQHAQACVRLAGAFVPADLALSIVDNNVRGAGHTAGGKRSWSALMATLLEGAGQDEVGALVVPLTDMVRDLELSLPDAQDHQVQILRLVRGVVTGAGPKAQPVQRSLFASLLRLQGLGEEMEALGAAAQQTIEELGTVLGYGGTSGLYEAEIGNVLSEAVQGASSWRRDSQELRIFNVALRHGHAAVCAHASLWVPVFALAADHNKDADVRSVLLVLLDFVLQDSALRPALVHSAHGATLLVEAVVPVCVWRAGKVASALRKGGVCCLRALLRHKLVSADTVAQQLGQGFTPGPLTPVLKSCLDDDDAQIRFITCQAMVHLFELVEGRLDQEMVRIMYLELLKRLDDSNDSIRIHAAQAFTAFLPSVPRGYEAGQFDYIVRGLAIHLDDQNPEVQEGVLPALLAAASVNPTQLINVLEECRTKHRSTAYCDRAIAHARELASM